MDTELDDEKLDKDDSLDTENKEGLETDIDTNEDDKEEERVPLATLLKEKARRKELENKLKEIDLQKEETAIEAEKNRIKERYIKAGYDDEFAEITADEQVRQKAELRKVKDSLELREFRAELKEIALSDTFFKDVTLFEKEIRDKQKQFKGITIEEAYMLVRGNGKNKEFQTDVEQKAAAARREAIQKGTATGSAGGTGKQKFPLTAEDKIVLAGLQKHQPNAGWTAEKFTKLMK